MTQTILPGIDSPELAKKLYNMLMVEIEPDLVLTNIPLLDDKYAGETAQQKEERLARYEAAYQEFDKRFAAYAAEQKAEARTGRRSQLQSDEAQDRHDDNQILSSIEEAFS